MCNQAPKTYWDNFVEKLREELTSGDPNTKKLLTELLLSIVLKDSGGSELSNYIKNLDIALSALRDFFRPLIKGSIFNQSITANTNIFSSDLTPSLATTSNPVYFRIFACFNASGVLSVVKTKGATTVTMQLNSGTALNANALYAFDIIVESGESVNLQYSVNATALELKVEEIASTVV
jgi:hypothetical protein